MTNHEKGEIHEIAPFFTLSGENHEKGEIPSFHGFQRQCLSNTRVRTRVNGSPKGDHQPDFMVSAPFAVREAARVKAKQQTALFALRAALFTVLR